MHIEIEASLLDNAQLEAAYDSNQRLINSMMGEDMPRERYLRIEREHSLKRLREQNVGIHELLVRRSRQRPQVVDQVRQHMIEVARDSAYFER